jgi:hypothetical protein
VVIRNNRCPHCQGRLEEGFLLGGSDGEVNTAARWVEGPPVKNFLRMLKLKGRRKIDLKSFRCRDCGFLETYAIDDSPRTK